MATTTPLPIPRSNPLYELSPAPASVVDDRMEREAEDASPEQNRSSSLSDIEDRADEYTARSDSDRHAIDPDPNDTEAETERLEDSPHKLQRKQDLVLTAANLIHGASASSPAAYHSAQTHQLMRQRVDAASLRESSAEGDSATSVSQSPRKRKRSEDESDGPHNQPGAKRMVSETSSSANQPAIGRFMKFQQSDQPNGRGNSPEASDSKEQESEENIQGAPTLPQPTSKRGKRRTRKAGDGDAKPPDRSTSGVAGFPEMAGDGEAAESAGEDVDLGDRGGPAGSESTIKDEEVAIKKKSALDSLSAIEKCFASLRDKLYDERLAKCDVELAMLEGAEITHPELLSMKEVLEQRRDEKMQYENTLLKYKLGSLQNKSVAEKAQVHGQYMQTVREIRDRNLEQVNEEWYQIHKERRSREDDVPEYMYLYPTQRSHQIANQAAYNKEVSLLSGIAKYRGFPAAPEIRGAKPTEIEADLERLGIIPQPVLPLARHPPPLRASLSANAVLPRPNAVADEHFLEQNPWANPQHPAHLRRQASALSRTVSPSATPVSQKRAPESLGSLKVAPTLADAQRGSYPSMLPTPAIGEPDSDATISRLGFAASRSHLPASAPTRQAPPLAENSHSVATNRQGGLPKNGTVVVTSSEKAHAPASGRFQAPEIHMRPYVPKISRRTETNSPSSGSTAKLPTSPPGRFPVIKSEDIMHMPGRSPTPQRMHRSVPVHVAASGARDR
ncbi:MAG: hypothetical protein Q9207_001328 [Kuettlingeria erythrocarpa]